MKRLPLIGYLLKNILSGMYYPGEPKKKYIDETKRLRAAYKKKLIRMGFSKKDAHRMAQKICTYRKKIFSSCTLESYLKSVTIFQKFCQETLGTARITLEQAAAQVQAFIEWRIKKGHSANTIHNRLSAVCKALGLCLCDFRKPIRHYSDISRGIKPAENENYNKRKGAKALAINQLIGVRRSELGRIKLTDIRFISPSRAEVYTKGKGGKRNMNLLFTAEDVAALKQYVDEAAKKGQVYLLTKEEMKNDANLHAARAERAKAVYASVCADLAAHPEHCKWYLIEIVKVFCNAGKVLKEDLDKPYRCRSKNRQKLMKRGKETVFNRLAVMFVSCCVTNHFRSSTTVNFYLVK